MSHKLKVETKMRNRKSGSNIHNCPICGSKHVNLVEFRKFYCVDCCIEFDDNGKVYTIMHDGTLVDYHINEFAELV